MKRYSILDNLDYCFFCGRPAEDIHEVYFGTANRKISIQNGFCVGLCKEHHNLSNNSVHKNKDMNYKLKELYQEKYEETHTRDEFRKLIGRSYL